MTAAMVRVLSRTFPTIQIEIDALKQLALLRRRSFGIAALHDLWPGP